MSHTHMEHEHRQRQRRACYQVQSEYRCTDDVKDCQQLCVWPLVGVDPENKGTTRGCHCPLSCAMLLHGVLYLYISAQFARSFTIDACCFTIQACCFTIEACCFTIEACCFTIEECCLTIETCCFTIGMLFHKRDMLFHNRGMLFRNRGMLFHNSGVETIDEATHIVQWWKVSVPPSFLSEVQHTQ